MTEKLVHFIHIPKAAGNTVMTLLNRQYGRKNVHSTAWGDSQNMNPERAIRIHVGWRMGPEEVWFPETLEEAAARFNQLPEEQRARVLAIRGFHIEYGLHEYLEQPVIYFTVLRNPVDRALSHYYFTADHKNRPEEIGLYEHIAAHISPNLQTEMLSGPHGVGPLPPPEEMLEQAKRNVRACAAIGLTERFDETALLLQKALGWRTPLYANLNVNKKRPRREAIPEDVLHRIEADNDLDIMLYQYAQELFEAQVVDYGPSLEKDLRTYRTLNWIWQRWYTLKNLPRTTAAAFNQHIYTPIYRKLAEWGKLRHLVPPRLSPRVVAAPEDGMLYFNLMMGKRIVGKYDPKGQQWLLRRPYHLFVDIETLPSTGVAGQKG